MDVDVQASLGVRSRRPTVLLSVGQGFAHLTPADAHRVARNLIGAASSALADAAALEVAGGERLTTEEAAGILERLRAARTLVDQREGTGDL